jgi:hypothetical protein
MTLEPVTGAPHYADARATYPRTCHELAARRTISMRVYLERPRLAEALAQRALRGASPHCCQSSATSSQTGDQG